MASMAFTTSTLSKLQSTRLFIASTPIRSFKHTQTGRRFCTKAKLDDAASQGRDAAMKGVDAAKRGGQQMKQEVAAAADTAANTAKDVSGKMAGTAQDAAGKMKQTAENTWETVKETAKKVKDTVAGKAEEVTDAAKKNANEAAAKANSAMNSKN